MNVPTAIAKLIGEFHLELSAEVSAARACELCPSEKGAA